MISPKLLLVEKQTRKGVKINGEYPDPNIFIKGLITRNRESLSVSF